MRNPPLFPVVAVVAVLLGSDSPAQAADAVLIYVDDVVVADPSLRADAAALTAAMCTALGKDKRIEVLCAPDVKQILGFAATASMVGSSSPALDNLQRRLEDVDHVVAGSLKRDGGQIVWQVKAGHKAEQAAATALFFSSALVTFDEKAPSTKTLADRAPSAAERVVPRLLHPEGPVAEPPAPLAPGSPPRKQ